MADLTLLVSSNPLNEVLVPVWFYLLSGLAYFASSAVSLGVSYFALRIYRKSNSKKFLLIGISFLLLGLAYLALTIASIFSYDYVPALKDQFSRTNLTLFNFYYLLSLVSYVVLFLTYIPLSEKRFFAFYVPLWFTSSESFHMASIFLITFILLRSLHNFYRSRSLNSFLVLLAFSLVATFHLTTLLLAFDLTLYLVSHVLLAAGFLSLLIMLIRVSRSG